MSNHETGKNYPTLFYRELYCALYGATQVELGFKPISEIGRNTELSVIRDSRSVTISHATRNAERFVEFVQSVVSSPDKVEDLQARVTRLARLFPKEPAQDLAIEVSQVQRCVDDLLGVRRGPSETEDLLVIGAMATSLMANIVEDMGDLEGAARQAVAAFHLAKLARHRELCAWATYLRAKYAYWGQDWRASITLATRASELAGRAAGSVTCAAAALLARSHAAVDDEPSAMEAIDQAQAARESWSPSHLDAVGGDFYFPYARQLYYVADAALWLPNGTKTALRASQLAISEYGKADNDSGSFSNEAHSRFCLSFAYAQDGLLDGCQQTLAPVLALPPALRTSGLTKSMRRLDALLQTSPYQTSQEARGVRDDIEAFVA